MTFLSPRGGLMALGALMPLAALGLALLRAERIARVLGLQPPARRHALPTAVLTASAFAFLGLAAAQPAWRTAEQHRVRTASQVFFVVDVSRSMVASESRRSPTRLARARGGVARLRAAVPDVPSGVAGLTDRVLPYLFPTLDANAFAETLRRSVTVESPPPQQVSTNATSFDALVSLSRDGFFVRAAEHRTCVLVTDAETRSYSTADVVGALSSPRGCRLLVVRVAREGERVFGADGSPEPGYVPDPAAAANARTLAEAAGGRPFSEGDLDEAAAALRRSAEVGRVGRQRTTATNRALAPLAASLTLAAIVGLLALRLRRPLRLREILTST